ncbi:hypothetical protein A0H81_06289 [Grifola frondosa]|uniref:Uncharacterized protein n=1 Tax=Grifola frondosa TaxID=5627 RepID=A0A1C7MAV3_GRIFR|nr:hypothetical protein A0H81_06289 [Grifola frondosa]
MRHLPGTDRSQCGARARVLGVTLLLRLVRPVESSLGIPHSLWSLSAQRRISRPFSIMDRRLHYRSLECTPLASSDVNDISSQFRGGRRAVVLLGEAGCSSVDSMEKFVPITY